MNFVNQLGVGTKDYRHVCTADDGRARWAGAGAVATGRGEGKVARRVE